MDHQTTPEVGAILIVEFNHGDVAHEHVVSLIVLTVEPVEDHLSSVEVVLRRTVHTLPTVLASCSLVVEDVVDEVYVGVVDGEFVVGWERSNLRWVVVTVVLTVVQQLWRRFERDRELWQDLTQTRAVVDHKIASHVSAIVRRQLNDQGFGCRTVVRRQTNVLHSTIVLHSRTEQVTRSWGVLRLPRGLYTDR
ncbi:hypothetical protein D3C78_1070610 [compost metagenome]